jgi:hypothetical protein
VRRSRCASTADLLGDGEKRVNSGYSFVGRAKAERFMRTLKEEEVNAKT